jgi:hypothetical protein
LRDTPHPEGTRLAGALPYLPIAGEGMSGGTLGVFYALIEVEDFYLVVLEVALKQVAFYEVDYFGDDFVGVAGVRADAGNTDGGRLPVLMIGYFGCGYVELVGEASEQRLYVVPLVLQRVILRQIKGDSCGADDHGFVVRTDRGFVPGSCCVSHCYYTRLAFAGVEQGDAVTGFP